jgi:hypothetical protein
LSNGESFAASAASISIEPILAKVNGKELLHRVWAPSGKISAGFSRFRNRQLHGFRKSLVQNGFGMSTQHAAAGKVRQALSSLQNRSTPTAGAFFLLKLPFQQVSQQNNEATFDLATISLCHVGEVFSKVANVITLARECRHCFQPSGFVFGVKVRQ